MSVVELPSTGFANANADLAEWLHAYADSIAAHPHTLRTIQLVIEGPNGNTLSHYSTGTVPLDRARAIGLLTITAARKATDTTDDELGVMTP